jgi:hypothetical protein
VKWISYVVILCTVVVTNVFGSEFPSGITSEEDKARYCGRYAEGRKRNSYDTTELVLTFKQKVEGDRVAVDAMDLFIDCEYWHLVDYCENHLVNMTEPNAHLFKEAMVLLAPQLDLGNYEDRVVDIIGDKTSVTLDYFVIQHRPMLFNMFFHGAVASGRRGLSWILIETCINACNEIEWLAGKFKWSEYDQFKKLDVRRATYGTRKTEDRLWWGFNITWTNLPSPLAR